ncbi:MAG: CaiB/BaiF CoA-transferase family protein [Pseudomonadota bacterium]
MMKSLEDVLVVALEQAVAAPFASARLADAGARVIKIERPGGDFARRYDTAVAGESSYFVWLNRGKQSLVLDLDDDDDVALLHRLVARADVFLQNLAPGAAERRGFGGDRLRTSNPRLIVCEIRGFAADTAFADAKAYDLVVQAESGLASVTGSADAPGRVGAPVVDIGAGQTAHAAILEALFARERTGEGASLSIAMFDVMADWLNVPLLLWEQGGEPTPRTGLHHSAIAPYGVYATADGPRLLVVQNEREWQRFCAVVLGRPDLATDPDFDHIRGRVAHRTRLDAVIEDALAGLSAAELDARLAQAEIASGRVNDLEALSRHAALTRAMVDVAGRRIALAAPPVRREGRASTTLAPPPRLDEHGAIVRSEFR